MDQLAITLDHASGVPLYRQLTVQLTQLIQSGQLAATARLPAMHQLARQLGISLITVRRAYADLEGMGLVTRRRGRGTRVCDDVTTAALAQTAIEIRQQLSQVVNTATRLGIDHATLRAIFEVLLDRQQQQNEQQAE